MSASSIPHIVFFDDRCAVCSAEIGHYKNLVQHHSVHWAGISASKALLTEFGLNEAQVLKRLHVLRSDGVMVTGAYAFATIWSSLRYYRGLSWALRTLRMLPLLQFIYKRFADYRFDKKYSEHFECSKQGLCKR